MLPVLQRRDALDDLLRDAGGPDDILAQDGDPRRDGADRELGLPGQADLAHDHDVERRVQGDRDLIGDDDAAARHADEHEVLAAMMREALGQLSPRVVAIAEPHVRP